MKMSKDGLMELKRKLEIIRDTKVDEIVQGATDEIVQKILALTVMNTPVDTGFLKNGWDIVTEGYGVRYKVTIYNNVEYAIYVEYGHRTANGTEWVKGQFMFTIAKNQVINNDLERTIEKHLSKGLEGLK